MLIIYHQSLANRERLMLSKLESNDETRVEETLYLE